MSDLDERKGVREQSSMTYWWPKLKETSVKTPDTIEVGVTMQEVDDGAPATDGTMDAPMPDESELIDAVKKLDGPPAFIRTDQMSAKHEMGQGSKISTVDTDKIGRYGWQLFENHSMAWGVPQAECYYVREWLDLKHEFTAFRGNTPISSELRVFVNDGAVHDVGFYWPHDAIRKPNEENWKEQLTELRKQALSSRDEVESLAERVGKEFDGYWSVDFAETETGEWYCIDMARGEASWHPDGIEKAVSL